MALDIYTIGGGEIIYEVLKAVSLCLNGGQGVLHGLIRIGSVSGLFIIYYMFVMRNVEYVVKKWGNTVCFASYDDVIVFVCASNYSLCTRWR